MASTLIFQSGTELLEGPVFDFENNFLYFVSILDCLIYRYNPSNNEIDQIKLNSPVGCIFLSEKDRVIAASKDGFFEVDFNSKTTKFLFQIDINENVRFNDGKKDPMGRLIVGTMGYPEVLEGIGKVFSYYKGECHTIIENTTISNGIAFTKDNKHMYFIDTPTKKVAKYQYHLDSGKVKFDSNVIEFSGDGTPDGMCIDEDGMLWVAEWGGACISRHHPGTGKKLDSIALPCLNVTSCCFDNHSNLYVTTAKSDAKDNDLGGGLFYVELHKK